MFHVKKSLALSQANKLTNYCFAGFFIDVTLADKCPDLKVPDVAADVERMPRIFLSKAL